MWNVLSESYILVILIVFWGISILLFVCYIPNKGPVKISTIWIPIFLNGMDLFLLWQYTFIPSIDWNFSGYALFINILRSRHIFVLAAYRLCAENNVYNSKMYYGLWVIITLLSRAEILCTQLYRYYKVIRKYSESSARLDF